MYCCSNIFPKIRPVGFIWIYYYCFFSCKNSTTAGNYSALPTTFIIKRHCVSCTVRLVILPMGLLNHKSCLSLETWNKNISAAKPERTLNYQRCLLIAEILNWCWACFFMRMSKILWFPSTPRYCLWELGLHKLPAVITCASDYTKSIYCSSSVKYLVMGWGYDVYSLNALFVACLSVPSFDLLLVRSCDVIKISFYYFCYISP